MTDLIIHCGAHKTATTSIQNILRSIRKSLTEHKIYYILPSEINSIGIIDALRLKAIEVDQKNRLEQFFKNIIQQHKPDKILISHESFFSFVNLDPSSRSFYSSIENSLEQFSNYGIKDIFNKIRIIFYIRRQDSFLISLYLQHLSTGVWIDSFDAISKKIDYQVMSWIKPIRLFEEQFELQNIIIRPFEKIKEGSDIFLKDFFYSAGINYYSHFPRLSISNQSFSKLSYQIAINTYPYLSVEKRKVASNFLKNIFPANAFGKTNLISKELSQKILHYHQADNARVFERYIKDYPTDFYAPDP